MAIVELALAASGKAATAKAIDLLLRDFLSVQDQHARALEALHTDLRRLVEGPWRRARTTMEDAILANGPRRRELLSAVLDALREAHSYESVPSAVRAAVAAEMAIVASMLGYSDEGQRWARNAHVDAVEAIRSELPDLTRTLNTRVGWLARERDDFRHTPDKKCIFWKLITEYDRYDKAVVDRQLWRQAFTATFCDGIELTGSPGDREDDLLALGLPLGNKKAEFAAMLAGLAQRNVQGARVMRLHRLAADAEEYRQVRAELCTDRSLPVERLHIDLSVPYRARLEWAPG